MQTPKINPLKQDVCLILYKISGPPHRIQKPCFLHKPVNIIELNDFFWEITQNLNTFCENAVDFAVSQMTTYNC
jgi:hypothetical protein